MTKEKYKIATLYVTGYESNNKSAISGWDWFIDKKLANQQYDLYVALPDALPYRGELQIELPKDYDILSEEGTEEVNGIIELFLGENDWENAFNTQHPVIKWVE